MKDLCLMPDVNQCRDRCGVHPRMKGLLRQTLAQDLIQTAIESVGVTATIRQAIAQGQLLNAARPPIQTVPSSTPCGGVGDERVDARLGVYLDVHQPRASTESMALITRARLACSRS
jgi:hypothetical protein